MTTIIDMPKLPSKRPRLTSYDYEISSNHKSLKKKYSSPIELKDCDLDIPTTKYDFMTESERADEIKRCEKGIYQFRLFTDSECKKLEDMIDNVVESAKNNEYKKYTVDSTPLRTKYFFGEGYTYGGQMIKPGPNQERLYAKGEVDDIPLWIHDLVIKPLLKSGLLDSLLPKNKEHFFSSVVINDYAKGGCIAPHIDPIHIFCRPIITISLSSDSYLSFGSRFIYKPLRSSKPLVKLPLQRGTITSICDYASDNITHCVCPEDVQSRRTVIILRRVCDDAPRLPPCQEENHSYSHDKLNDWNKNESTSHKGDNRRTRRSKDMLKRSLDDSPHHVTTNKSYTRRSKELSDSSQYKTYTRSHSFSQGHLSNKAYKHRSLNELKKVGRPESETRNHSTVKRKQHAQDTNLRKGLRVKKSPFSYKDLKDGKRKSSLLRSKNTFSRDDFEDDSNLKHFSDKKLIRGNDRLHEKRKATKVNSDDEDKTVVVKRKNKKFRVRVQSNEDKL